MLKQLLPLLLLSFCSCVAQQSNETDEGDFTVAFYNVENLFDTVDDSNTHDEDFTPHGAYRYSEKVYKQKLHNIATVISQLDNDNAPAMIGLAEIENKTVLEDLTSQYELEEANYKFIHYDSYDGRGIDVALLYQEEAFTVLNHKPLHIHGDGFFGRDILYVSGVVNTDTVHIFINHWPSRREGLRESMPKRLLTASVVKKHVDSLLEIDNYANIIVMGDFNDNPVDESIDSVLSARDNITTCVKCLYNPWIEIYNTGRGASVYHRKWDMFDQILISAGLADKTGLHMTSYEVYDKDFIRNNYDGDAYPKRSFRGRQWNNGYSDHLPVLMHFSLN